ncbi:MAG: phosphatidylglycerophosphatase A family protein [Candidatus Acidiferrales bacterium]
MSRETDLPSSTGRNARPSESADARVTAPQSAVNAPRRKPRISLLIATACGLGYLPRAPGTWGSLAGLACAMLPFWTFIAVVRVLAKMKYHATFIYSTSGVEFLWMQIGLAVLVGAIGVFSATIAATFWNVKDPQRVVIDEVSGQHLTLVLGCALPIWRANVVFPMKFGLGLITARSALNWKYLLLGFILFRVFDIWKPFPARQAESLPGGWGIMADDWMAGIYAGLGLWVARALGF